MAQSHREASRRLIEIAEQQQGFFTTKQAKAAGFAENTHPYQVQVGNWIREHRGIYRLTLFRGQTGPNLCFGRCGPRTAIRKGRVSAATMRRSAPRICGSDPSKLHMTVPMDFHRNSEIPGILVLHSPIYPE